MFIGYDIETEGDQEGFALQPWRVLEGSARVTISSAWKNGASVIKKDNHQELISLLKKSNHKVALWNCVFDLAFLYASGINIDDVKWYDAMLLCKWLLNGQRAPMEWNLLSMSKLFLPSWNKLDLFKEIKTQEIEPGADESYWTDRATLDVEATALIADIVWDKLTPKQRIAASIQAMTIPTIAASWVHGVHINLEKIKASEEGIVHEMLEIETKLGLTEPFLNGVYIPSKVLSSPQKLAKLVYGQWGHNCERFTDKTKKESADKTALTYLTDHDDRMFDILRWRELNTIFSKFVKGPIKTCKYLGSNVTHSSPKMFSTYTGRMTYSSSPRKGKGIRYGLPIHQTPRNKEVRSGIIAPPGHYIFEADASGQEMRFMAVQSKDETMIKLFNSDPPYDDGHSLTGSKLLNMSFEEFIERKKNKDVEIVGPEGGRHAGKFTNLSCMYRTSNRTLRIRARVQYNLNVDLPTATTWKSKYLDLYKGVKTYWTTAPQRARIDGYAETLAGRRYHISKWRKDDEWGSESSAINFPIQGTGADQRDLAIATLILEHPDLKYKFYFDLHDGLYLFLPIWYRYSKAQDILWTLNNIKYEKFWGIKMPVPLLWEGSFGPDWGHKIGVKGEVFDGTLEEYYKKESDK